MTKLFALSVLVVSMISSLASANEPNAIITNSLIQDMITRTLNPTDLINWKVGDTATYNVTLAGLPFGGSMVKSVTKDDGATLELTEDVDLTIQKQNVVAVINKADGKIVKMTVNGQDQAVPDDKVEVISQDVTEIDVPAGHFKCIHIVAKTAQVSKLEEWANPSATVMDGSLKVIENGQTTVTMELKSFAHGS